jgi:hypothetical protein
MFRRWLTFWFEPSTPINLVVSRVLFFGLLLAVYWQEDFSAWAAVSRDFWMPLPVFKALHLSPMRLVSLHTVQIVWRVALALSAVGLATRLSTTVAFVLGFYLLGLPHNFGHTFHFDALLVIAMGVLACSRAGDWLSIDAWMRESREPQPSGEYTWPLKMIWVATALVFFAAGLAKLRYGGPDWALSSNMSILLTRAAYHVSDADPLTRAGLWIAGHEWLSRGLAASALLIELSFVLALINRTARAILVPAAFGLLVGIRVLMGPTFGGFLVVNVFWVPWDAVGIWLTRIRSARQTRALANRPDVPACPIQPVQTRGLNG